MSRIEFDPKGPDWRITLERRDGKVTMTESTPIATFGKYRPLPSTKARGYTNQPRPVEHNHGTDPGDSPVIVLDLNGTLTEAEGFPLSPPVDGVKESLDTLIAAGCCLHIATAALGPQHPDDVNLARQKTIAAWSIEFGLPVSFITGKVSSHVFYDDRMVNAKQRDWADVMADIHDVLLTRFDLGDDGIYRRRAFPEIGTPVEDYPEPGLILADTPRALSTRSIDVDLHRCLFEASSSKLTSEPKPGAVAAVTLLYNMGYQVRLSCQGWDPASHTPQVSASKLASLQQQVRGYAIPYDEMVAKDHGDAFVDDKGIHHADWATDLPQVLLAMATPLPDDEVTGKIA